jgi:hypothetical protein
MITILANFSEKLVFFQKKLPFFAEKLVFFCRNFGVFAETLMRFLKINVVTRFSA